MLLWVVLGLLFIAGMRTPHHLIDKTILILLQLGVASEMEGRARLHVNDDVVFEDLHLGFGGP